MAANNLLRQNARPFNSSEEDAQFFLTCAEYLRHKLIFTLVAVLIKEEMHVTQR